MNEIRKKNCSLQIKHPYFPLIGESDWFAKLQQNYGLKKGLVDVNGEPVEKDFDDQADMCEIIRALVASGKFEKIGEDVKNISMDLVDSIDCAGNEG